MSKSSKKSGLLGYNAPHFGKIPTVRRNITPPSSMSKSKPGKKPCTAGSAYLLIRVDLLLSLFFNLEDGSDIFLRNVWPFPNNTLQDRTFHRYLCENPKSNLI
jgi:hypothetical protein